MVAVAEFSYSLSENVMYLAIDFGVLLAVVLIAAGLGRIASDHLRRQQLRFEEDYEFRQQIRGEAEDEVERRHKEERRAIGRAA